MSFYKAKVQIICQLTTRITRFFSFSSTLYKRYTNDTGRAKDKRRISEK